MGKTPRPTFVTPRPTKNKTPKPTNPPKTPKPTQTYLTNPPKSTRTYLTPEPTITYVTPEPTKKPTERPTQRPTPEPTDKPTFEPCPILKCPNPCPANRCHKDEECVIIKEWYDEHRRCPACDASECQYVGWGAEKPMTGCAENTGKKSCSKDKSCIWRTGYPPLEFSEDADYQLLEEERFFAVDGSVVEMINNMDSNMWMISGVVFVAFLLAAIKLCSTKKVKFVDYEPIEDVAVVA